MNAAINELSVYPELLKIIAQKEYLKGDMSLANSSNNLPFGNRRNLEDIDVLCIGRAFPSLRALLQKYIHRYESPSADIITDEARNFLKDLDLKINRQEDSNEAFDTIILAYLQGCGLDKLFQVPIKTQYIQVEEDVLEEEERYISEQQTENYRGISICITGDDDNETTLVERLGEEFLNNVTQEDPYKPDGGNRYIRVENKSSIELDEISPLLRVTLKRNTTSQKSKESVLFDNVSQVKCIHMFSYFIHI